MSSGNDHWNTPKELWEPARKLFHGTIELDPFSNETSKVPAVECWYGEPKDGLELPWTSSLCFVNGPWSKTKWVVEKCVREWMHNGAEIVAVIPTSLNASYWHHVEEAPATCCPRRRVSFLRDGEPVKGNRQDCVIVYWGPDIYRFRALFSDVGRVRFG